MAHGDFHRNLVALAGAAIIAFCTHNVFAGPNRLGRGNGKPPNIVYILTDDLGYGDVSVLNPDAAWKTPNMDRLANSGMVFTDAHSGSAVCTPTRYGVLTGRYSWRGRLKRGVLGGWSKHLIERGRMTVGSLLQKHGYSTACIGKWHLGLDWQKSGNKIDFSKPVTDGPNDHGFDYSYIIPASLDMAPYVYLENNKPTSIPTKVTVSRTKYGWWRKGLTGDDFVHEQVLPHLTDKTVEYIDSHAKTGRPFFVYFAMPAPHTPILPTDQFKGKSKTNPYGDYVLEVDYMIGRIIKALRRNGILDNTLVIVTSDNGCSPAADYKVLARYGHNPSYVFRGTKSDIFEGGHRIPFIVSWPAKIKPGGKCTETICLTDLLATCADIIGEKLPDNAGEDSVSLLPVLRGKPYRSPLREATVHHSIYGCFAIRRGKWKLEMCAGSGGWSYPTPKQAKKLNLPKIQLYDLSVDISERRNVYKEHPEVVRRLAALLRKYVLEGRSTPGRPQPYYKQENWPGLWWLNSEEFRQTGKASSE